ncbi:hypothetical protein GQ600_8288 [Phytophthora cactorum]|nr:hypothetical protein GQ600_8288 [Phytophthora cactorum]
MPRKLPWKEVVVGVGVSDGNEFLETLKAHKVSRSQPTTCGICTNPLLHSMQYMLLTCVSKKCCEYAPTAKCPWRGKVLICERSDTMAVFELHDHFTTSGMANPSG